MPVPIIAAALVAQVGTEASQMKDEKKKQKSLITQQDEATIKAEEQAKNAETLAKDNAVVESRKRRTALTRTILTSPLGVQDKANVSMPVLFGGN